MLFRSVSQSRYARADTYNIGGFNEWTNIDLVKLLCAQMDEKLGRAKGESGQLITYVKDRPGHDRRYAIDATKLNKELGWTPSVTFEQGLAATIHLGNKSSIICVGKKHPMGKVWCSLLCLKSFQELLKKLKITFLI